MADWTEELCKAVKDHEYVEVPCCLDGADTTCLDCLSMDDFFKNYCDEVFENNDTNTSNVSI